MVRTRPMPREKGTLSMCVSCRGSHDLKSWTESAVPVPVSVEPEPRWHGEARPSS